tara:strand:- start:128 stop:472 length:345 start_codon:yes stop_codon:yes gene_type:complete
MQKYKGFPSRMPGTDYQFTIRRANPRGVTKLIQRERYRDRKVADQRADTAFLKHVIRFFGKEPFERGCLDAGRLSWFLGREIVPVSEPFNPQCYEALLRVDLELVKISFPSVLE